MPRIYLPSLPVKKNLLSITDEKARYLTVVLRCRRGDDLLVFDGEGNCFRTRILKIDRKEVTLEVFEKLSCHTESPLNITLVQGLLKSERMDFIIQKTTELGIKEIIPLVTERSQLRETRKFARWKKIAEEASRQSGRTIIPAIHEVLEFKNFFAQRQSRNDEMVKGEHGDITGFIFWEEGGLSLKEVFLKNSLSPIRSFPDSPIHLFIGPEGGFTKKEVALAKEKGIVVISLGNRILRSETAAISAVTLIQFLLGDLG
ncbi:MAG: 16S rRNA (uracil(1498)-N(3))-methyltransferase [Nitrospirota bacterium]